MKFEAIITLKDGTIETIDPIHKITIDNGHHEYFYNGFDIMKIEIKPVKD